MTGMRASGAMLALTMALLVSGCTAGTVTENEFYRDHPAATAPMLFAPSRLKDLRAHIDGAAGSSARALSMRIEPKEQYVEVVDQTRTKRVELRNREGVWAHVDTHEVHESDREEVADDRTFALDDAHLEALPVLLKTALARAKSTHGVDEFARVWAVKIERRNGRVELVIRCGSGAPATLVYDGAGTWLEDRP